MNPIELLVDEHRIILKVLDAADREAQSIRATRAVHGDTVRKMIDFIREFADRCHHAKEEKHLFRVLGERGMPVDGGPIGVMLAEHDMGRARVREIERLLPKAESGDGDALDVVADTIEAFAALLRAHISKEDTILYPMAENILSEKDMAELGDVFERVESEEIGAGVHEKYHAVAKELSHL